jgi:hypothetical protein
MELTEMLGRRADLRTPEDLSEYFRDEKNQDVLLFIDNINVSSSFRDTLVMDKIELSREEREKLPRPSLGSPSGRRNRKEP